MGYPLAVGVQFALLLGLYAGSFVLVGRAVRKILFGSGGGRAAADLLLGFLAAPVMVAAVSAAAGCRLWVSLVLVDAVALGVLLRRRHSPAAGRNAVEVSPVVLPLPIGDPGLLAVLVVALLLNAPYISGLFALPVSNGNLDIGPQIFDIEPAVGVTTSLAAYGLPARHHAADSVPLLYYTGFYVVPAAVAGLCPSLVIPAVVGGYVFGSVAFLLVLWQLVTRHFPTAPWRLLAGFLVLSGTTLGLACWRWTPYFQDTALSPFVEQGHHHDTIIQFLLWMPRHALPAILALLVLEGVASGGHALLRALFFPVVYLLSTSVYVGMFLAPALAVGFAWLWWSRWRGRQDDPAAPQLRPAAFAAFAAAVFAAVLPHYWTTFAALGHAGAPTGRLTHALFAPPVVGTLFLSCGLGLLIGLPVCFVTGRRGWLWLVYLATLLTSTFNSEVALKGTNILMVLVAFLSAYALYRLWVRGQRRGAVPRLVIGAVLLLAVSYAVQSFAVGLQQDASLMPQVFKWRRELTPPGFELVRWVREHTRINQKVSLVQNDRTVFEPLFGRVAFAAGPDAFYNWQFLWADTFWLRRHQRANPDLVSGLKGSDYVVVARDALGFGDPRIVDSCFEEHRRLVRDLGFAVMVENEAGLVARNPFRRRPAQPVSPSSASR